MTDQIKRKARLMRLQKAQLSKAQMEHQAALGAAHNIQSDLDGIHQLIEADGLSVRAFPEMTYDHIRKLDVAKRAVEKSIGVKRAAVSKEEARMDRSKEQIKTARAALMRTSEEAEAVENITRRKV